MRQFLLTFTALLLWVGNIGFCQQVSVERYTQENGLPSDLVKALAMDGLGFIWVATDNGVVKIEGGSIVKPFENHPSDRMYKKLFYSHQGMIAASDLGLFKISQDFRGLHINYFSETLGFLPHHKYAKQIFESKDSSIWIAFPNHIIRVKNGKVREYNFEEKNNTYHYFRGFQIFEVDSNQFYALSQKGYLHLLDLKSDEFVEIPWDFSGTEIFSVYKLNDKQFLIGCSEGLLQMNFKNGEISDVENLNFKHPVSVILQTSKTEFVVGTWFGAYNLSFTDAGLRYSLISETEDLDIQDIILDKQKQVWIATGNGIFAFRQLAFHQPFVMLQNQDIKNFTYSSALFFSVDNRVYRLDRNNHLHKYFTSEHGDVTALFAYEQGLYVGTNKGQIIHKKIYGSSTILDFSKQGHNVYSLALDKNKNLWFLQQRPKGAALIKIDSVGNILDLTPRFYNEGNHSLNILRISPYGELYIAAQGRDEYLYHYNYETNLIENLSLTNEAFGSDMLLNFDLSFLGKDTLLLANQKGVFSYHNQIMERLELGFYNDKMAMAVFVAKNNKIWINLHDGLLYFDNKTNILYNDVDGLPSKFINPGGLFIDEQNNLWAGTTRGLVVTEIQEQMPQSSTPIISGIKKSGVSIDRIENKRFLQNSLLHFTFASPDYPAKFIKYQYALVKNNEVSQWIDLENKKDFLFLETISAGNYILKVRARNIGHFAWSEPATYKFKIYKMWYTRPGYIAGINLVILLIGYLYIRYRQARSRKYSKELETVITLRTKELVKKNEELIKTQNQLIQSEKMASIGILAAGVAHEINNPVNYINGGIAVLKKTIQKLESHLNNFSLACASFDAETKETFNLPDENTITKLTKVTDTMFVTIEDGIKKTTDIVQSIRIFSSNSENVFSPMDVNEALDSVLLMLYNKYKGHIDIVKEYDANAKIMAIPANIQQVLMNLLVNAIQAIPQKGIIWIGTKRKQSTIVITIKDSGKGIPSVIQKKIFDPFYSTKDVGQGTGLGLYLTYNFVKQHHGTIKVNSEPGKGAEFVVELPLTQQTNG
jgi:signal transduction histidine kinase/ligand-binding sensor domain-containing protein